MTCADFDARLDDLLDGALAAADRAGMEAHLAGCAACAVLHADLVALGERARRAPREVAPPPAVWAGVSRVTNRESGALARFRWTPWSLAAAAALLVALSSAGTVLVLRDRDSRLATRDSQPSTFDLRPGAALPPRLAALEADYRQAAAELVRALEADPLLTPASREAVSRHVAVVDAAIAEARASVLAEPAAAAAGELLLTAYRQKLDLLERASRLLTDS